MNDPTLEIERPPAEQFPLPRERKGVLILSGAVALSAAVIAVYSQTNACAFDEGFHLLAAQLIKAGRRPYLDFFFAQAPLNAWWNAAWMRLFGESWRVAHAAATVATVTAVTLAVDFVYTRVPWPRWRLPVALASVVLIGGDWLLVEFGPISQAYGLCLLLTTLSFRFAVEAAGRRGVPFAALAGCAAAGSAASSLLTAPIAPVVLLWILFYSRIGSRIARCAAFAAGAIVPWLPVLWLALQGPFQVRFGIVDFHLFFRQVEWDDSLKHNLELLTGWIDSEHALVLSLLAVAGLLYIARSSGWLREHRAEFYLAGWMAAGQIAYLCYVQPTFAQYFSLSIPFLGILASVGFYAVATRLANPERPWLPFSVLAILLCFGLGRDIYSDLDSHNMPEYEQVARKVDQVTPPSGSLLSDEFVYFMTKRRPPSGLEYDDSHKLQLSDKDNARLHIYPRSELARRVQAGMFDTVESCDDDDDDDLVMLKLPDVYAQKAEVQGCKIYWQLKAKK
ncbi:MAG TPA: hypothetical protein VMJ34_03355 [Bryobacteraceae bacterium]|nr:hypothetical protein [Bryobacteraceae bacterium]